MSAECPVPIVRKSDRGVALVTTLLLLGLLSVMTLGMVIATNSDTLINGYYRNFRSAFYAADSGLNVARQSMLNQLTAAVPSTFSTTAQPISASAAAAISAGILSSYGSTYASLNAGQAATSWPGAFEISAATLALGNCTVIGGGGTCDAPTGAVTGYHYIYNYTLSAVGQARGSQQTKLDDSGSFVVNVDLDGSTTASSSFAAWGTFIDSYNICSALFVPGTITGPVFTNDAWTFGDTGSYIFTDSVGSASAEAGYYFTKTNPQSCIQSPTPSYKYKGKTISPTFQNGLNLGQPAVPLPANDYSQKRAILDGLGTSSTDPSNAEMNAALKKADGSAWPTGGASSGVYVPYSVDSSTGAKSFTGGGIYVQGDATVTLAAATESGTGHSLQVFNITQGSGAGAVTTTVTLDLTGNTTTIADSSGASSGAISGLPQNLVNSPPSEGAMVYVNGSITSLSTQSGQSAAIQDSSAVTITAASDVAITGDVKYKTEPVTLTQNEIPGTPADTLIPGNDNGQVLGIFTGGGDIQLKVPSNNMNLQVDASLAMIKAGGSGGLINTWNRINTLTIVGGRIANQAKQGNVTTRDIFFDRRFSQNGFAPPWFPSTTVATTGTPGVKVTPSTQRVQWINETAY
jgi:Tfp pilus assembly protein PilX